MTETATFSVFGSLPIGGGNGGLSESQVQAIAQVEVTRAIKRQRLLSSGDDTVENGYKLITTGSLPLALRTLRTGEGIALSTVTSTSDTVGSVMVSASEDLLAYGSRIDELDERLQGVEVWGTHEEGSDNRLTQVEVRMDVVEGGAASKANQDEVTEIGAEIFANPPYREGVKYRLTALEAKVNPAGPQGPQGETGLQGEPGMDGAPGLGLDGLANVDVFTVEYNEPAIVVLENKTLAFFIPRGYPGAPGVSGVPGQQGVQGEVGPQGETADDLHAATVHFDRLADLRVAEVGLRATIEQRRLGQRQAIGLRNDLGHPQHFLMRIERQHANRRAGSFVGPFPRRPHVFQVHRCGRRDLRMRLGQLQITSRKLRVDGERVALRMYEYDVGVETFGERDRAIKQRAAKAELHEHQQHGKADPPNGRRQPLPIMRQVVPG